uniref:non-specific serine/threonine protein kinase n=1 Tax=Setaria digitata TaxID=48799 RepID=A0A915PHF0_9BILA
MMAHIAKKVRELATVQLFNLKVLLSGTLHILKRKFLKDSDYKNSSGGRGLFNFKKRYKLKGELGRGGFGVVYRGIRICDELPVAIKYIDRNQVRNWGKLEDERLPMEICMLARCVGVPGVIRLLDWYTMPEGFLIVMTRPYPCVDLFDFIKSHKRLDENLARFLFRQIVRTIRDCAQKKVLHRDLKVETTGFLSKSGKVNHSTPYVDKTGKSEWYHRVDENIVIDLVNGETFLVDFGAATPLKKNHYTDFQGTRLYCPPEWFLHSMYLGREAAVWSLGILLYNMLNGKLPFRNEKEICTSHLSGPLPFCTEVSKSAMDLIDQCLCFDPSKRCTLDRILKHSWIRTPCVDWCALMANTYDGRQYDTPADCTCNEQPESSYAESGVGSTSSFSSSTSSSFTARYRRGEPVVEGGIPVQSFRRSKACQYREQIPFLQSKTSMIGDCPSSMSTREFPEMVYLRPNNSIGRLDKAHSINHLCASTSRAIFSRTQNSEDSWPETLALGPINWKKRSTDSGQQSLFFSSTVPLPKSPNHEGFNERIDAVLVF